MQTPSSSTMRWFALRRWYVGHPLTGLAAMLVLVTLANAAMLAIGYGSAAPCLPFYPAIIFAAMLDGRRTGYIALMASLASVAIFLLRSPDPIAAGVMTRMVLLPLVIGTLIVEFLAQFSRLADILRAHEIELAASNTALLQHEAQLSATLSELEALYNEAPVGLGFLDHNLRFLRINAALAEMANLRSEALLGQSVWDLVPDLQASTHGLMQRVLDRNEVVKGVELRRAASGQPGLLRDWFLMFYPVHDPDGQVQGVGVFCQDVTEAKRAHERERLLMREVDHRAKNLLTVIQSVLRLTRSTGSVDEFQDAVTGRIQSLGRVHALLAENRWEGVRFDALIRQELDPFGPAVRLHGASPAPVIQPNMAQAISMIVHELATNSRKHGALSGAGHVDFTCVVEPDGAETGGADKTGMITLIWQEVGGPGITEPDPPGFGTNLIRTAVSGLLAGELSYELRPEGLHCAIRFPASHPEAALAADF